MFLYISEKTVAIVTETVLRKRYTIAATVPGTQVACCFIPVNTSSLEMSTASLNNQGCDGEQESSRKY